MSKFETIAVTDPEIFDSMGIFEMGDSTRSSLSIRLQFAKFAHGFTVTDFESFVESVGAEYVTSLGRLSFPNEWQMTLNSKEIREELIRLGRTRINNRSCWIHPLSSSEIRGFVHWLPNEVPHFEVRNILRHFGEVLFIETQSYTKFNYKIASDARYFALYLKPGAAKEDIPHFIIVAKRRALITIRGRQPACFHCREVGHRKNECKTYREKLGEYCLRPPGTSGKRGKRGRRHKKKDVSNSADAKENLNPEIATTDLNKAESEVQSSNKSLEKSVVSENELTTKQDTVTRSKNKKKSKKKKKNVNAQTPTVLKADGAEHSEIAECTEEEDPVADNSANSVQNASSAASISVLQLSLNNTESSVIQHASENFDGAHNLDLSVDDTKVLSTPENGNTLLKAEEINLDLQHNIEENTFVERITQEQNTSDVVSDCLKNSDATENHILVSAEIHSLEDAAPEKKSDSVMNCNVISEKDNKIVHLENCSNENLKNFCNDLTTAKDVKDSFTNTACNASPQVPEKMQADVNHQIGDIFNNFILQVTDVLSEAGVLNVNEIKNKLCAINGTMLHSKKSNDEEAKCDVIQHDKNSNIIDPSNVSKVSKKKKKKAKKCQE